jgi:predicted nucleic acid-binding protein
VSRAVLLDAGPIGLLTNPKRSAQGAACAAWLHTLIKARTRVVLPEITDYEVRRELLRANKLRGVAELDGLALTLEYLPLTTAGMRLAAVLWAQARQQRRPTAGNQALDVDVILAAQAMTLGVANVVIATTNVSHLSQFVPADLWQNITP